MKYIFIPVIIHFILDTLTVKEAVATDVELPTKRLRRADFSDSDEDIEVYQVCRCYVIFMSVTMMCFHPFNILL